jgi:hypothetical protein
MRDILQKGVQMLFSEHKADETNYKRKFKAYKEAYLEFDYEFLFITSKDNFVGLDMDQFQSSTNG